MQVNTEAINFENKTFSLETGLVKRSFMVAGLNSPDTESEVIIAIIIEIINNPTKILILGITLNAVIS